MVSPYTFIFLISLVLAGCGMDDPVDTSIVEGEAGGPISVYVSEGDSKTRPIYTWFDGGDNTAMSLSVARASDLDTPVWEVQSPQVEDNIPSPVDHGMGSPTAVPTIEKETDLQTDVSYRVTVRKTDPSRFGYREFTIKP